MNKCGQWTKLCTQNISRRQRITKSSHTLENCLVFKGEFWEKNEAWELLLWFQKHKTCNDWWLEDLGKICTCCFRIKYWSKSKNALPLGEADQLKRLYSSYHFTPGSQPVCILFAVSKHHLLYLRGRLILFCYVG